MLSELYGIDELSIQVHFYRREKVDIPEALELKRSSRNRELLKQLEEAAKTAQIGLVDMEALSEMIPEENLNNLNELREQIQNYVPKLPNDKDYKNEDGTFDLTPKAYKAFQSKLLKESSRISKRLDPDDTQGAS